MELKFDLVDTVKPDPLYGNYDYRKFSVKDETGKHVAFVFEHDGEYLNLKTSTFFKTKEDAAAAALPKRR